MEQAQVSYKVPRTFMEDYEVSYQVSGHVIRA